MSILEFCVQIRDNNLGYWWSVWMPLLVTIQSWLFITIGHYSMASARFKHFRPSRTRSWNDLFFLVIPPPGVKPRTFVLPVRHFTIWAITPIYCICPVTVFGFFKANGIQSLIFKVNSKQRQHFNTLSWWKGTNFNKD